MAGPFFQSDGSDSADLQLALAMEEFTTKLQAGEAVDVEAYAQQHPECAEQIRQLVPALRMLANLGSAPAGQPRSVEHQREDPAAILGELGDFQLVRELGRGGMGIVYEAEQVSLGRRVALKMLPFAATVDARQLQRFRNEAKAAAQLHHQSIVPVFGVGCERGVHYYAMQYIDGQSLAALIVELRQRKQDNEARRQWDKETTTTREASAAHSTNQHSAPVSVSPCLPVSVSAFCRTVAHWGVQAALALEHAHEQGVVHRDIKPANLMIDGRGQLWITDFGLALIQGDGKLTMTGDLVGTLRYMSPEQALGQRGLVDHRTDIYSLGVTLYELMTLEPAVTGDDRREALRQIAFDEPRPPRRLNRNIPTELETIVLKAIRKETEERYATGQELADDLRRFLEDRPILAKRPTLLERVRKWMWRHRALVWTGAGSLIAAMILGLAVHSVLIAHKQHETTMALAAETQAKVELKEALQREREAHYGHRLSVARQYWMADKVEEARFELEQCLPDLRDREWRYLHRVCHAEVRRFRAHNLGVGVVQYSPDGRNIVTVGSDPFDKRGVKPDLWTPAVEHTAKVWDAATAQQHSTLRPKTKNIRSLAFSHDGNHIIAAGSYADSRKSKDPPGWEPEFPTEVTIWDWRIGRPIGGFQQRESIVAALVCPDGRRVALLPRSAGDLSISIYDPEREDRLFYIGEASQVGLYLVFREDGLVLATNASGGFPVRLWDMTTGELMRVLNLYEFNISRYSLSPDGGILAALGSEVGVGKPVEIRTWEVATGRQIAVISDKGLRNINRLCFSPDGRYLAMAGQSVVIWDLQIHREAFTFRRQSDLSILSLAFSPDGQRLACGNLNGYVQIFDVSPID